MRKVYLVCMLSGVLFLDINPILAKIPFTHMFQLERIFDGFEECHPLLGWTALHKNLIYNLRFNGNFEYKEKRIDDVPLDNISHLIKLLFPSPSGSLESFAVHGENIGYLIKSGVKSCPGVIAVMLRLVRAQKEVLKSEGDRRKKNEKILNRLKEDLVTAWRGSQLYNTQRADGGEGRPRKVIRELIECLLGSVRECVGGVLDKKAQFEGGVPFKKDVIFPPVFDSVPDDGPMVPANVENRGGVVERQEHDSNGRYAPYLVEQILMAFLCDRFDTRKEILDFLEILKKDFHPDKRNDNYKEKTGKYKDLKEYNCADFILKKNNFDEIKDGYIEPYINFVYGASFFEAYLPYENTKKSLGYDQTGRYLFDGKKTTGKSFSDCVESTFRQFLNILLFDSKEKNFKEPLRILEKKIKSNNVFKKLLWFYFREQTGMKNLDDDSRTPQDNRDSVLQGHQNDRFGKVVEDLNSGFNSNKMSYVYYVHEGEDREKKFELDAGPLNTLAVFENLLGIPLGKDGIKIDEVRSQAQNAENKNEFFCLHIEEGFKNLLKLFQRGGFEIHLKTIEGGYYVEDIKDYCDVTLMFEGSIDGKFFSFYMSMGKGHHSLYNLNITMDNELIDKKERVKVDPSFLTKDLYNILYSWDNKRDLSWDFYTLYSRSLSDQGEKLGVLHLMSQSSKEKNDQHKNILKSVISSIAWDDPVTAKDAIVDLIELTRMIGDDHPLVQGVQKMDLTRSSIKEIKNGDLPQSLEELDLSEVRSLISFSAGTLKKLKTLNLSYTSIFSLEEKDLPKSLTALGLMAITPLQSISIGNLTGVTTLNLSYTSISSLEGKNLPPFLTRLSLINTEKLENLSIRSLTQLETLNIKKSKIKNIKEENLPINFREEMIWR